jgi:hypothetical protein
MAWNNRSHSVQPLDNNSEKPEIKKKSSAKAVSSVENVVVQIEKNGKQASKTTAF